MKKETAMTPERELLRLPKNKQYKLERCKLEIEKNLIQQKRLKYDLGKLLSSAKSILSHGAFMLWIEQSFEKELPYSTAWVYMKIYDTFKDYPSMVETLPIPFLMSMYQKNFPKEVVDLITANQEYIEKLDIQTVQDAYKMLKDQKLPMKEFFSLTQNQIDLAIQLAYGKSIQRRNSSNRKILLLGSNEIVTAIRKYRKTVDKMRFLFPESEQDEDKKVILNEFDKLIKELQEARNDIAEGKGLFKPVTRLNPLKGVEIL